jgi:hypothetical protein
MSTSSQSSPTLSGPAAELLRWSAAGLIGLLALVALLVTWRRLAGALNCPLGPAAMTLVGASLAGVAVLARLGRQRRTQRRWRGARWDLLLSAAVLLLAYALWIPGCGRAGLLAFWAILAGEEGWAWGGVLLAGRRRPAGQPAREEIHRLRMDPAQAISPSPSPMLSPSPLLPDGLHPSDWPSQQADEDVVPAEDVLQQLTLSRDAAGGQRLCGWLRLRLAAGQRSGVVHVAFCPPFSRTPELSLEQLEGPAARVRTAQLLPHGVRLDLKLAVAASSGGSVLLRFAAWTEEGSA